jgi:hypothetical protein
VRAWSGSEKRLEEEVGGREGKGESDSVSVQIWRKYPREKLNSRIGKGRNTDEKQRIEKSEQEGSKSNTFFGGFGGKEIMVAVVEGGNVVVEWWMRGTGGGP